MSDLESTIELEDEIEVEVEVPIETIDTGGGATIDIDSLDGGGPSDVVYVAINANGLTGISGGTP